MPKRTSAAEQPVTTTSRSARFVIVTLNAHLASAVSAAQARLRAEAPGLTVSVHVAAEWEARPETLRRCREDIARADFLLVTQLFLDEHVDAVLEALTARQGQCDAIVCAICAAPLMRLTRMGKFRMDGEAPGAWSPLGIMRRLTGAKGSSDTAGSGERQMKALRRVPALLRFIPGTAQDVRAYYLVLRHWFAASPENLAGLVRIVVSRYGTGPRAKLLAADGGAMAAEHPDVGVYHPDLSGHVTEDAGALPTGTRDTARGTTGTIGLLLMRSYVLAGNTAHYDAVIRALEARGLRVVAAFSAGLDGRPAIERYFTPLAEAGQLDAVVSLTGFSLVGGPAYNDATAAHAVLGTLDVPYFALQTLELQGIEDWKADPRGLNALQATLQVALPELDGAIAPHVFGGAGDRDGVETHGAAQPVAERVERLADRVAKLARLRHTPRADRRVAVVLFNFPPNAGSVGTAAYLDVFTSLHNTLHAMRAAGYTVDVPESVDALRALLLDADDGAPAHIHARIPADEHVRDEPHLEEIERAWGAAPGQHLTDGRSLFVLGARLGNVFIGVQPAFGYEGDPMRLLFERGFAPTHAFSAFYRWLREDFDANAVLHFGTHGALEFMPGKQTGLTGDCWPERLLGDLPNFYLYACNNPSEGALAKRRAAATLISYLTPSITHAGLYRGLSELRSSLDRLRSAERLDASLVQVVQAQAAALELTDAEPAWTGDARRQVARLDGALRELEQTLIPSGLHVVGAPPVPAERIETLLAMARAELPGATPADDPIAPLVESLGGDEEAARSAVTALVETRDVGPASRALGARGSAASHAWLDRLGAIDGLLAQDHELPAIVRALDGRFVPPAPGGDVLRTPAVLPTGRNVYAFDPYRIPSATAMREGAAQADALLARHTRDAGTLPETVAVVLWGTETIKSEGASVGLVLALLGAAPRTDALGRVCGARLLPLEELRRPRIDVVVTLSGIFRDLFPLQTRLLAEAASLAATADEPEALNPVRAHTLAAASANDISIDEAALRVFGNAEGTYGANVNQLVDGGTWTDPEELARAFARRKAFAYDRRGAVPVSRPRCSPPCSPTRRSPTRRSTASRRARPISTSTSIR